MHLTADRPRHPTRAIAAESYRVQPLYDIYAATSRRSPNARPRLAAEIRRLRPPRTGALPRLQ